MSNVNNFLLFYWHIFDMSASKNWLQENDVSETKKLIIIFSN